MPCPFSHDIGDVKARNDLRSKMTVCVGVEETEVRMHGILQRRSDLDAELDDGLQRIDHCEEESSIVSVELHCRLYRKFSVQLLGHDDPVRYLDVASGSEPKSGESVEAFIEILRFRVLKRNFDGSDDLMLQT